MQFPGPDGFLLDPADPLHAAQLRLNDYLLAEEQRDARTPIDSTAWKKLPKKEIAGQTEAVLVRLRWLVEHDAELESAHLARERLRNLLRVLYGVKAPFEEGQLIRLLDCTTSLLGRIAPYGPVDRVTEFQKSDDLTPDLCRALREFQAGLREEGSESQSSMQSLRQCLHMLLWMDEWEPLDPGRCWSECIRRDFRVMKDDRKVRWRALLKHLRGNAPVRMPAGWARAAAPLLDAVGIEDFRECIGLWFAPFRSGEKLPLTVAGSHVLKCLIWYCAVANDAELRECALWLLDVKWRQKRNVEKSMVALAEFGIDKDELRERNLIAQETSDPMRGWMHRLEQVRLQVSSELLVRVPDGEGWIVQGQLHFYRLLPSTLRIERASDGAEMELDWPATPDSLRKILRRECDSEEQLFLRAHLLMYDAAFGRYFRATLKS